MDIAWILQPGIIITRHVCVSRTIFFPTFGILRNLSLRSSQTSVEIKPSGKAIFAGIWFGLLSSSDRGAARCWACPCLGPFWLDLPTKNVDAKVYDGCTAKIQNPSFHKVNCKYPTHRIILEKRSLPTAWFWSVCSKNFFWEFNLKQVKVSDNHTGSETLLQE